MGRPPRSRHVTHTREWSAEGNQAGSHFGAASAGAGDVNGDGYVDVIVGAPDYNGKGRVFVYHGSASGLGASAALMIDGDQAAALFGATVASAAMSTATATGTS